MNRLVVTFVIAIATIALSSCAGAKRPALRPTPAEPGASLWQRPTDLAKRDLFYGAWGREHEPSPRDVYTFVERKHAGVNPGMTVRDSLGREWSVKQPVPGGYDFEGSVEVTLSRLLWAIGYHQPPVYYLPAFTLKDDWGTHREPGGRFRLKLDPLTDKGPWKWQENPFVGSKPYQGLLVALVMFNSTDLKNSNTTLYEYRTGNRVEHWYVVRDIGAALGDANRFTPLKGDPIAFERHAFIIGVSQRTVEFAYKGWYDKLVRDRITPDDVAWVSNLLGQLTDRQWRDAFRAGGFEPWAADRFIGKLQEKIDQGRSVTTRRAAVQ
jgi:hypothetical protein